MILIKIKNKDFLYHVLILYKKSLYNIFYTCKYDKKLIILLLNGFVYNLVMITELKSINIYFLIQLVGKSCF